MKYKVGDVVTLVDDWEYQIEKYYYADIREIKSDFRNGAKTVTLTEYIRTTSDGVDVFKTKPDNSWYWKSTIFKPIKEVNEI
jgi:hypothetical protein